MSTSARRASLGSPRLRFLIIVVLALLATACLPSEESGESLGTTQEALSTELFSGLAHFVPQTHASNPLPGTLRDDGTLPASHDAGNGMWDGASEVANEIGADFTYRATVQLGTFNGTGVRSTADLQFRISAEGRYGVAFEVNRNDSSLTSSQIRFYRFKRKTLVTNNSDNNNEGIKIADALDYISCETCEGVDVRVLPGTSPATPHDLAVRAIGTKIDIYVDNVLQLTVNDTDRPLYVGRFGLYSHNRAYPADPPYAVTFSNVAATADESTHANYSVLYSTLGYEAQGKKKAFLRSLVHGTQFPADTGVVQAANYQLIAMGTNQTSMFDPKPLSYSAMFGMRLWTADFSDVTTAGNYKLRFNITASGINQVYESDPFPITTRLLSNSILKPLSVKNALARDAAVEDFRNNWQITAGASNWSVEPGGAFVATGADSGAGAIIERVMNGALGLEDVDAGLQNSEFQLTSSVAILNGCDAALQFWITPSSRYAVTLTAGLNGRCPTPVTPTSTGTVRLSRESSSGYQALVEVPTTIQGARQYDVHLRVAGGSATVELNGVPLITNYAIGNGHGRFGLRAFSSTAKFDKTRVWQKDVAFTWMNGLDSIPERVATVAFADTPGFIRGETCEEAGYRTVKSDQVSRLHDACYPLSSQRHGFHDCNNFIGESMSHGTFLSGLVDVWTKRRTTLTSDEQQQLRNAIITADTYLEDLFRYAGSSGRYAHEEPSRGGPDTNLGYHNTIAAIYGESALAIHGGDIDPKRARAACVRVTKTVNWLELEDGRKRCFSPEQCAPAAASPTRSFASAAPDDSTWYNDSKSLFYQRVATCAAEYALTVDELQGKPISYYEQSAATAADMWTLHLATGMQGEGRDIGRQIPWLEGADEVYRFNSVVNRGKLHDNFIAMNAALRDLVKNGFNVVPEANNDPALTWTYRNEVPTSTRSASGDNIDYTKRNRLGYGLSHFAVSAYDASVLYTHVADSASIEPADKDNAKAIAAGSIGWVLGLNPGLPATKVVGAHPESEAWSAAAFFDANFDNQSIHPRRSRGFTSFLKYNTQRKPVWPARGENAADLREAWWINPNNSDFVSIPNGHVVIAGSTLSGAREGTWEYWNQGVEGWESGETFMAIDGTFIKALIAYEDALAGTPPPPLATNLYAGSPRNAAAVFDVTAEQRLATGWGFGNIDTVSFADASRMAHNFCSDRGFPTGHPTGQQNVNTGATGVTCYPTSVNLFEASTSAAGFSNIDNVAWATAARSANAICSGKSYVDTDGTDRRYVSGFYTGHQGNGTFGLACLRDWTTVELIASPSAMAASGWNFSSVDTVPWAQARRAADSVCSANGHPFSGYFTGVDSWYSMTLYHRLICAAHPGVGTTPRRQAGLVDAFYLGQGPSSARGLRIHSLMPNGGDHEFMFSFQDINSGYGANDMYNWKVAGDLNGDGHPDLVDTFYLGQNPSGIPSGIRVHTALSTGPQSWAFGPIQDINSGYGANDMTNWKVIGDLNGDGRPDLVDTYYLGVAPPGYSSGLRIHTILSTGAGTWTFGPVQDINQGYGFNDMTNWKPIGDLNGDGRPDLVDTVYLGQNAPGIPSGLRIHMALSTGPGTWVFASQDADLTYDRNDMMNWKVTGDLNGDGRPDLVNLAYLGQGTNGQPTGLRVYSALTTGPGSWTVTHQDVNPGYGANDVGNWNVADVNGDGRPDLVAPFYLGPGYGLRIHVLLSTGPGAWRFTFNDIDPAYGANDMANWKVMDINNDGFDDLVDTFYLGQSSTPRGLRLNMAISNGDGSYTFDYRDLNSGYGANDMSNWRVTQ